MDMTFTDETGAVVTTEELERLARTGLHFRRRTTNGEVFRFTGSKLAYRPPAVEHVRLQRDKQLIAEVECAPGEIVAGVRDLIDRLDAGEFALALARP